MRLSHQFARLFLSSLLTLRVPNRFGGMRDLAIFHGDIRDLSRKQGREVEISVASGSGNSYFGGFGCEIGKGNGAGYRISIPT